MPVEEPPHRPVQGPPSPGPSELCSSIPHPHRASFPECREHGDPSLHSRRPPGSVAGDGRRRETFKKKQKRKDTCLLSGRYPAAPRRRRSAETPPLSAPAPATQVGSMPARVPVWDLASQERQKTSAPDCPLKSVRRRGRERVWEERPDPATPSAFIPGIPQRGQGPDSVTPEPASQPQPPGSLGSLHLRSEAWAPGGSSALRGLDTQLCVPQNMIRNGGSLCGQKPGRPGLCKSHICAIPAPLLETQAPHPPPNI